MTLSFARTKFLALVLLALMCPASARAGESDKPAPHIRVEACLQAVMSDGMRSPTFRALVTRIEQSNLIVYVRCHVFPDQRLAGRLALMGATRERRFLIVELACARTQTALIAALGHELRHAVEIASAPAVVDAVSMQKLYEYIGFSVSTEHGSAQYDTENAIDAGWRVRRELQRPVVPLESAASESSEAEQ
jgi:hypothetical protein